MTALRQESFAAGELAPALHGRTSLAQYGAGARQLLNFFISPQGVALNRPGTRHVYSLPGAATGFGRLIPFDGGDGEGFVLCFRETISIYRLGAGANALGAGAPFTLPNPYLAEHAKDIHYAQSGRALFLAHPLQTPRMLIRRGHWDWALEDLDFTRDAATFSTVHGAGILSYGTTVDETHIPRRWQWAVTSVTAGVESLPRVVTHKVTSAVNPAPNGLAPTEVPITGDAPVVLSWLDTNEPPVAGVTEWRVYRGRDGVFGYIGSSRMREADPPLQLFQDLGEEPDYALQPPKGTHPFELYDTAGVFIGDNFPAAVGFFQGRLWFGGGKLEPAMLWGSRVDDYTNFDTFLPSVEDEALRLELAGRRFESVRHLVGAESLLAHTSASVWRVGGEEPLSPSSFGARAHAELSTNTLAPILTDAAALICSATNDAVHELSFSDERARYIGSNLTLLAQHLFLNRDLVDWAYAREPFNLVWAVRDDGKLLCLQRVPEQEMCAWTLCETAGVVRSVAVIREEARDVLYLLVERDGLSRIEVLTDRLLPDLPEDGVPVVPHGIFLDAAYAADTASDSGLESVPHLAGLTVGVVSGADYLGTFEVPDGGMLPHPEGVTENAPIVIGLPYTCDLETLDAGGGADARGRQKNVTAISFEVEQSRGVKVGPSFGKLTEWRERQAGQPGMGLALRTEHVKVAVAGGWALPARACLRHDTPYPLAVLAVVREVELGER